MRYDFKSLSSQDFEELIRDLLQAEWNTALEAFRSGRDDGIDLRYSQAAGGAAIIQCKHYVASGFAKLLAHLRSAELPKIRRLSPARYVVATSVELTPGNKDDVVAALQPFVVGAHDVIGANDVEGLLIRHPEVERANFKLWLTSTSVLERVLRNARLCQTDFEIERIQRRLPLFVQTSVYARASALLDETRIVVVTGPPGIGKTTLAEMLLYSHLQDGYEPVVIKAEIADAKDLFRTLRKQIFYYDDFLGQTFLGDRREYLGRNQDAELVDFMEMVRRSPHSRFILTTREHILSGALQASERLAQSPILGHRCILEMGDYSYGHRARLLYNHLYFSDLPQEYKDQLLEEDFFLDIIKHKHFNPRLIEWLAAYSRLGQVSAQQYRTHISALLEAPESIWAHAFHHQISDAGRHVLLSFNTLGGRTDTVDLEPAFIALHRHNSDKYQIRIGPGDFRRALQELDGAFLSYNERHASYLNPSVRDFVGSVLANERETAEDVIQSAARFKQIVNLWELAVARPDSHLRSVLTTDTDLLSRSLGRLLQGPSMRWEKGPDGTASGYPIDTSYEGKVGFLAQVATVHKSTQLANMAVRLADSLVGEWGRLVPDFGAAVRLLAAIGENRWFFDQGGRELCQRLWKGLQGELVYATADDWLALLAFAAKARDWNPAEDDQLRIALRHYVESGAGDERRDYTTVQELLGLRESLEKLRSDHGLDFGHEIDMVDEDIAECEEETLDYEGGRFRGDRTPVRREAVTDDELRAMFQTLRKGN